MKTLSSLLILVSACGSVQGEDTPDAATTPLDAPADGSEQIDSTPSKGLPISVEPIRAATLPGRLSDLTFANGAAVSRAIYESGPEPAFAIAEQRIVATSGDDVRLRVSLMPPHGAFTRTLVTAPFLSSGYEVSFGCADDPRCTAIAVTPESVALAGSLTAGRYLVTLVDEQSGAAIACDRASPLEIECTIPGIANRGYRVVVSGDGFRDLWDWSTSNFADAINLVAGPYTGGPRIDLYRSRCVDRYVSAGTGLVFCRRVEEWAVVHAIDSARIDFAPMTISLSVGEVSTSSDSPPLAWDLGNDDVPGTDY